MNFKNQLIYKVFFCLSILSNFLMGQDLEEENEWLFNMANRWRIEGNILFGLGLDKHEVGQTTENEKVNISGGGGLGGSLILGYGLTNHWDLSIGFGMQKSYLEPEVENADGNFFRTYIHSTLKYKLPLVQSIHLNFGIGADYYFPGNLDIDFSKIPGGGHNIFEYENASGFHLTADFGRLQGRNLYVAVGLRYSYVKYSLKSADFDGINIPISLIPNEMLDEIGSLDGSGVDLIISLGLYL